MTTNYTFYTVETDPMRPFLIRVRSNKGGSEAVRALTERRVHFMSTSRNAADAVADKMTNAMSVVLR